MGLKDGQDLKRKGEGGSWVVASWGLSCTCVTEEKEQPLSLSQVPRPVLLSHVWPWGGGRGWVGE